MAKRQQTYQRAARKRKAKQRARRAEKVRQEETSPAESKAKPARAAKVASEA